MQVTFYDQPYNIIERVVLVKPKIELPYTNFRIITITNVTLSV